MKLTTTLSFLNALQGALRTVWLHLLSHDQTYNILIFLKGHAWLFFFFFYSSYRPAAMRRTEEVSSCATAASAHLSACSSSRGLGGEEASPGVTLRLHHGVAQIKVYKQRRTRKVALKSRCRWNVSGGSGGCAELNDRSHWPTPRCDRGAQRKKKPSPQMFPLSPST